MSNVWFLRYTCSGPPLIARPLPLQPSLNPSWLCASARLKCRTKARARKHHEHARAMHPWFGPRRGDGRWRRPMALQDGPIGIMWRAGWPRSVGAGRRPWSAHAEPADRCHPCAVARFGWLGFFPADPRLRAALRQLYWWLLYRLAPSPLFAPSVGRGDRGLAIARRRQVWGLGYRPSPDQAKGKGCLGATRSRSYPRLPEGLSALDHFGCGGCFPRLPAQRQGSRSPARPAHYGLTRHAVRRAGWRQLEFALPPNLT